MRSTDSPISFTNHIARPFKLPAPARILGPHVPLDLRDGDVVVTGPLVHKDDAAWPDMRSLASRGFPKAVLAALCVGLLGHRVPCLSSWWCSGARLPMHLRRVSMLEPARIGNY